MLGAPMAGASDQLLAQAVGAAAGRGLVGPDDHVVRPESSLRSSPTTIKTQLLTSTVALAQPPL